MPPRPHRCAEQVQEDKIAVHDLRSGGWRDCRDYEPRAPRPQPGNSDRQPLAHELVDELALAERAAVPAAEHQQSRGVGVAEGVREVDDLPEAEQELVGGYHTEYSGMKFGMFFLAEYVNLFVASFMIVTLFFGGYLIPFEPLLIDAFPGLEGSIFLILLQIVTLILKVSFFAFLFIWVRWTLPRFKYNQLMNLGWKYLLPIALVNMIVVAIGVAIFHAL